MTNLIIGIVGSAIVTVSTIFGGWCWEEIQQRNDIILVRALVDELRGLVLSAEPTEVAGRQITADELRAEQYNNMCMQLYFALSGALPHLSYKHKIDLLKAMRWNELAVVDTPPRPKFVSHGLPVRWPSESMPIEAAHDLNGRLESINWLKLRSYPVCQ